MVQGTGRGKSEGSEAGGMGWGRKRLEVVCGLGPNEEDCWC